MLPGLVLPDVVVPLVRPLNADDVLSSSVVAGEGSVVVPTFLLALLLRKLTLRRPVFLMR